MSKPIQFIVLGAGAIGCYFGARLIAAGQQVVLVGRPRTIDPLRLGGLRVTDLSGFAAQLSTEQLELATDLASGMAAIQTRFSKLDKLDKLENLVILLCVKGGATASAAREIAANCPPNTPVVSMQNGVENVARIRLQAPTMDALAGMVPYNVGMRSPTHVHRGVNGSIAMQRSAVTKEIGLVFDAAGLPNRLHEDMVGVQWGKLLINLNNPVNALSNLPLLDELRDWSYRRVFAALQIEALAVLKCASVTPVKAGAVEPNVLPRILQLPNFLFERVAAKLLKIDPTARSSMWDDVQRGNITEVDDLCGAVVRLAAQCGMQAPKNTLMCHLIAKLHKGESMSGPDLQLAVRKAV